MDLSLYLRIKQTLKFLEPGSENDPFETLGICF